jgi:hypothetical protein
MLLSVLLRCYRDDHQTGIRDSTFDNYLHVIASFERFLGRAASVSDFDRATLNRFVDYKNTNFAFDTMRSQRRVLLVLWNFAADEGLTEPPRKIRLPRAPERVVETWTIDEVATLRNYAMTLPGLLRHGIPARLFFASLVTFGYESGFRLSDQLSIEAEWIHIDSDGFGHLTIHESKTGKVARRVISRPTVDLVMKCNASQPQGRFVWPLWGRRESFFKRFKKFVTDAGVRPGTHKWLRRTAATSGEMVSSGFGQRFLNHAADATTWASYLDKNQITPRPLATPPLPVRESFPEPG